MAVVGVFAEADVGDHQQVGRRLLGGADRLGMMPASLMASLPGGVLLRRDAEQQHAAQAQVGRLADLVGQQVGRELVVAGHGGDLLPEPLARPHKQRQHQLRRPKGRLPHEPADRRVQSQSPHASDRKTAAGESHARISSHER